MGSGTSKPTGVPPGGFSQYKQRASTRFTGGYSSSIDNSRYLDVAERVGGCGCKFIGSAEMDLTTAKEYRNSANSVAKDAIIKAALDIATNLNIRVEGSDDTAKIKSLISQIPTGDRFKTSEASHRGLCTSIAKMLNDKYGSKLIEVEKLSPEIVCQRVAEMLSSLSSGMYSEFLTVYNDVKKITSNLHVLKDSLKTDHEAMIEEIRKSQDPTALDKVSSLDELHKMILDEIDRQLEMLNNLLNVSLLPSDKSLAGLIEREKDLHGYIERINAKAGTAGFGKVISDVLRGIGTTAAFAKVIQEALKTVGMTMDEYAKVSTAKELRNKIYGGLIGRQFSEQELHKYIEAAELLSKNVYKNTEIAEVARRGAGETDDDFTGGYTTGDPFSNLTIDKRVADRRKLRNLIFEAFYKQLNSLFDQFIGSLDVVSMKVGTTEIPLSDQLNSFRYVLQRVNESLVRNKYIYYALIGYYNDAMSLSKRDTLIGDFKMVDSYVQAIMEMPLYAGAKHYFNAIHTHIKSMLDLIEKFTEEISAKFGRGEDAEECVNMEGIREGGDDADQPNLKFKSTKSITDALRQFDYKYHVAVIRTNLKATSGELKHYGENYEKLVAHSIADILREERRKYDILKKELEKYTVESHGAALAAYTAVGGVNPSPRYTESATFMEEVDAAKKFVDHVWDVRQRFWATVEAIDAYMMHFTNGLVNHPEDIAEIKSMLDDIVVINDWYSERTGNEIATVFDQFPRETTGTTTLTANAHKKYLDSSRFQVQNKHYYETLHNAAKKTYVGNPYIYTDPTRGVTALDLAKKAFNGFGALKNLISVFIHIGSKFGGEELRKKVFMTPTQIYNNLVDYICMSAFAHGASLDAATTNKLSVAFGNDELTITNTGGGTDNTYHKIKRLASNGSATDVVLKGVYGRTKRGLIERFSALFSVVMRTVDGDIKAALAPIESKIEDEYFALIMKSLGAKILTVTGMYDVMDRPMEYNGLSPVRMIIGGHTPLPKVEEGAVPLYLRLPLLAQFYRSIFGFSHGDFNEFGKYENWRKDATTEDTYSLKISMVPDVDGVFSGLIRLIFRKNDHIRSETYSEEDMRELVAEVNLVYSKMLSKHPQNTVMETINEFVAEVNRRYGIVTRKDRQTYEREYSHRFYEDEDQGNPRDRYARTPDTDIPILPGEEDEEISRPSGAQRLLGESFRREDPKRSFTVDPVHKSLLYKFRCAIDKYFEKPEEEFTFSHAIKTTQLKLKQESNDEKRFGIVATLIRGQDVYTKVDGMKCLLFHETVVSGLNLLSGVHTLLEKFKRRAHVIDIGKMEEYIWKYWGTAQDDAIDVGFGTMGDMITKIQSYLQEDGVIEKDVGDGIVMRCLENLFGKDEAKPVNGGNVAGAADYLIKLHHHDGASLPRSGDLANAPMYLRNNGAGTVKALYDTRSSAANPNPKATTAAGANRSGLNTYLLGVPFDKLKTEYKNPRADTEASKAAQMYLRYIFSREWVMSELIRLLYGFSEDFQGLVKVKIEDKKLFVSCGGLKSLIGDMFQSIGYFLDLLRPHVSQTLIQMYTDKLQPGSFYWLQEQLMEKIINGRKPAPARGSLSQPLDPRGDRGYVSIDGMMQRLSYTYQYLTRRWDVYSGDFALVGNLPTITPSTDATAYESYDRVFSELIFYDATKDHSGVFDTSDTISKNHNRALANVIDFRDPYESLQFAGPPESRMLDTKYAARFKQLYTFNDTYTFNRSALFSFNQLVAKFTQAFFDATSMKIYTGLINPFANGRFNKSIMDQQYTYPDTTPYILAKVKQDIKHAVVPYVEQLKTLVASVGHDYNDRVEEFTKDIKALTGGKDIDGLTTFPKITEKLTVQNFTGGHALLTTPTPAITTAIGIATNPITIDNVFGTTNLREASVGAMAIIDYINGLNVVTPLVSSSRVRSTTLTHTMFTTSGIAVGLLFVNLIRKYIAPNLAKISTTYVDLSAVGFVTLINNIADVVAAGGIARDFSNAGFCAAVAAAVPANSLVNAAAPRVATVAEIYTYVRGTFVNYIFDVAGTPTLFTDNASMQQFVLFLCVIQKIATISGITSKFDELLDMQVTNPSLPDKLCEIVRIAIVNAGTVNVNTGAGAIPETCTQIIAHYIGHLGGYTVDASNSAAVLPDGGLGNSIPSSVAIRRYVAEIPDPTYQHQYGAINFKSNMIFGFISNASPIARLISDDPLTGPLALDSLHPVNTYTTIYRIPRHDYVFYRHDGTGWILNEGVVSVQPLLRADGTGNAQNGATGILIDDTGKPQPKDFNNVELGGQLRAAFQEVITQLRNNASMKELIKAAIIVHINTAYRIVPVLRVSGVTRTFQSVLGELSKATGQKFITGIEPEITYHEFLKYEDYLVNQPTIMEHSPDPEILSDEFFLINAIHGPYTGKNLPFKLADDTRNKLSVHHKGRNVDITIGEIMKFGKRLDPDAEHVLFTSLSLILKSILTSRSKQNQFQIYTLDNVADIPLYMKEKMRANLPYFRSLFSELSTRCSFLNDMMNFKDINLHRQFHINNTPVRNPWPGNLPNMTSNSNDTKIRFSGILEAIKAGCENFVLACDQTLTEIGDDPKYFELYQNSIKDYKTQHGVDPLMPLSTSLALLSNVDKSNVNRFIPTHTVGSNHFKFLYGCRHLLGKPTSNPMVDHAVGFNNIVEGYNLITDEKFHADKPKSTEYFNSFTRLLRYVWEAKHVKPLLTPADIVQAGNFAGIDDNMSVHMSGLYTSEDMIMGDNRSGTSTARTAGAAIANSANTINIGKITNRSDLSMAHDPTGTSHRKATEKIPEYPKVSFALSHPFEDVIRLTEGSNRDDKIKEIVSYLCHTKSSTQSLELQNIIDLGIIPINVHALMREIPLANLYNYAYTFDRLAVELYYGAHNMRSKAILQSLCDHVNNPENPEISVKRGGSYENINDIEVTKDTLVKLLINPYSDIAPANKNTIYPEVAGPPVVAPLKGTNRGLPDSVVKMLKGYITDGGLGIPKFLSDQLYGKCLLGNMALTEHKYDEGGPKAFPNIDDPNTLTIIIHTLFVKKFMGVAVGDNTIRGIISKCVKYLSTRPKATLGDLIGDGVIPASMTDVGVSNEYKTMSLYPAVFFTLISFEAIKEIYGQYFGSKRGNDERLKMATNIVIVAYLFSYIYTRALMDTLTQANIAAALAVTHGAVGGGTSHNDVFHVNMSNPNIIYAGLKDVIISRATPAGAVLVAATGLTTTAPGRATAFPASPGDARLPVVAVFDALMPAANFTGIGQNNWNEIMRKLKYNGELKYRIFSYVPRTAGDSHDRMIPEGVKPYAKFNQKYLIPRNVGADTDFAELRGITNNSGYKPSYLETRPRYNDGDGMYEASPEDTYFDSGQMKVVDYVVRQDDGMQMQVISNLRFNTVFVRNLIFIVNLYRTVRLKLQKDLTYNRDVILRSGAITRSNITEFYGNQTDTGADHRGVNR